MKLSRDELIGIFTISCMIIALIGIFNITFPILSYLPIDLLLDFFFQNSPLMILLYLCIGSFVRIGIIFGICVCIYKLIKKYKTKNLNPNVITVKRKFCLNQTELIILIGTICTTSIPFIILWGPNGNADEFLREGTKLLRNIIENLPALIFFILMIFAFVGVVGISLFIFFKNAFNCLKIDSIKSMSFDIYAKQINICYNISHKIINFSDVETLLLNIQTVKIPNIRPGVYKTAIRNDALGGFAKSIVAQDFATNNKTAVYEVEIVLKTIKNKEYKISVSTNSFFDPNLRTLFEQLVKYKHYFKNFEYNFIGPVIFDIERILKKCSN